MSAELSPNLRRAVRADARRIVRAGLREVAPEAVEAVEREDWERFAQSFRNLGEALSRATRQINEALR